MSFMDMRQWLMCLENEGELRRITAEVDWDREIGAISRRVAREKGPGHSSLKISKVMRAAAVQSSS